MKTNETITRETTIKQTLAWTTRTDDGKLLIDPATPESLADVGYVPAPKADAICDAVKAEREQLRERVRELEGIIAHGKDVDEALRTERAGLRERVRALESERDGLQKHLVRVIRGCERAQADLALSEKLHGETQKAYGSRPYAVPPEVLAVVEIVKRFTTIGQNQVTYHDLCHAAEALDASPVRVAKGWAKLTDLVQFAPERGHADVTGWQDEERRKIPVTLTWHEPEKAGE